MSAVNELPAYWNSVIEVLETYIQNGEDHWTLQTTGGNYDFAPYVQGLVEHDNMLLIEADIQNSFWFLLRTSGY